MRSSFSSCIEIIPVRQPSFVASSTSYTTPEFGLCESIIVIGGNDYSCDKWLFTLTIDQLVKSNIESLKISDGSDIWEGKQVTIDSLQIFTSVSIPYKPHITGQWFKDNGINMKENQFYRICIWYELIKILTGNRIFCSQCDNVIEYSDFVCHYNVDSSENTDKLLSFVLELYSNTNITRNLAQFTLDMVQNGEIDLFLLSSNMFEGLKNSNTIIKDLLQEKTTLQKHIDSLINEKKQLDTFLEKRDNITRRMMINLLNEKKAKIRVLESKLSHLQTNQVVDSDLINKYVHDPIFQLNSPGRRKRKRNTDLISPKSSLKTKDSTKIRNDNSLFTDLKNSSMNIPSVESQNTNVVEPKLKPNTSNNDFDNSKFFGINKAVNLDELNLTSLMKPEMKTPEFRVKDEMTIKKYNNRNNAFYRKEEDEDASVPYELIKQEDFEESFDGYINQGNNLCISNYPTERFKDVNLSKKQTDEIINNSGKGEKDDDDNNMVLGEDTSESETISETDIDTDIEIDIV